MKRLLIIAIILLAGSAWAFPPSPPATPFAGTESTTGSAGSLKSPDTTGLSTITGPGAGTTRKYTFGNQDMIVAPVCTDGQMLKWKADNTGYECTSTISVGSIAGVAITSSEVLIDCNGNADPYDHCTGANASTLVAADTSRTIINSYGRGEAQTVTLPAASVGMTFIALVGTQHNSAWKIQRAGSDTITWSAAGTDTTGKTYFQETNQAVGARVSCVTYKSAAAAWSWLCGSITGTWVTD